MRFLHARLSAKQLSLPFAAATIFISACAGPSGGFPEAPTPRRNPASLTPPDLYAVSGYLPENTGQRAWVLISGGRIREVTTERPKLAANRIFDTPGTIFPGFMDLSADPEAGVLPLSKLPRSEFANRFEWQRPGSPLSRELKGRLASFNSAEQCASTRWGEMKALIGGTTLLQGTVHPCAEGFGVGNIDFPADVGGERVHAEKEGLPPALLGAVFDPGIVPALKTGASYEQAYRKLLDEKKASGWLSLFREETHNVANALKLLVGEDFGVTPTQMSQKDFDAVEPRLRRWLAGAPYHLHAPEIALQVKRMQRWIFGEPGADGERRGGYLKAKKDEASAYEFLAKDGVLTLPPDLRHYIGHVEGGVRARVLDHLRALGARAVFFPLGAGTRADAYSRTEYHYAKSLGLLHAETVLQGGNAFTTADLEDAARRDLSLVWTPFSNLLLYGETLDVPAAQKAGVNLTLGTGTGGLSSKNLLDELKVARHYLNVRGQKSVTNRQLVEMVTVNAARALRMQDQLGFVKAGYLANLTLLNCSAATDPYDCAVRATPAEVTLVVTGGEMLYGDREIVQAFSKWKNDGGDVELLPRRTPETSNACGFRKAFRGLKATKPDRDLRREGYQLRSVADLEATLEKRYDRQPEKRLPIDPLFACEDTKYTKRLEQFVDQEVLFNRSFRGERRQNSNLSNDWSPRQPNLPTPERR